MVIRYFKYNRAHIGAALGWAMVFFSFFSLMQIEPIYKNTLGIVSSNYVRQADVITTQKVPFLNITPEGLLNWDAHHYNTIRETGYDTASREIIFLYAFFPLFPFFWRLLNISPLGIGIVNYFLFAASILILQELFKTGFKQRNESIQRYIIALCSPLLVVFLIPYTEALFMFCIAIGIYGMVKNRYWIYFTGFMLAAMTRSAVTILLISFLATSVFMAFKYFRLRSSLSDFFYWILPPLSGTFMVALYQYLTGSGKFLVYIDAIKTWDATLRVPQNLSDWSHESFSIVIGIICIIVPVLVMYLIQLFFKNTGGIKKITDLSFFNSEIYRKEYLFVFSLFYTLGMFLTILLFKGGSMNGVARYVICSSFIYFILYSLPQKIEKINIDFKIMFFGALALLSVFFLGVIPYSSHWNFADFGLWVFILFIAMWIFYYDFRPRSRWLFIIALLISALVWNTYLYNVFLSNGWLFT